MDGFEGCFIGGRVKWLAIGARTRMEREESRMTPEFLDFRAAAPSSDKSQFKKVTLIPK